MSTPFIYREVQITPEEASSGTKKELFRNEKKLEVIIPPGVRTGNIVRLTGALKVTDGRDGDIHIKVIVSSSAQGNWFQRHLNWTFLLSLGLFYGLTFGSGFITAGLLVLNDPNITDSSLNIANTLVTIVLGLLFLLPISAWVLDQKGRSLWFILTLFAPFGLIIFLCIENRMNKSNTIGSTDSFSNKMRINGKWIFRLSSVITGIVITGTVMFFVIAFSIYSEPTGIIEWEEIESNQMFWNTDWTSRDEELTTKASEIVDNYYQTHTYIPDDTDCNDMAVDIWNMLKTEGIKSVIVIGNLSLDGEYYEECDHAWLLVYDSDGYAFALEPTEDIDDTPILEQYWEGFAYIKPSDLKKDLSWRW